MKPALLVIDVQKQFFKEDPETEKSLTRAMDYILGAIELFRKHNLPIVFIQHKEEEYDLVPGKEGFDLPDAFKVLPTDIRITKIYGNSFNQTGLGEQLKALGVDTLVLTGYCAEHCVLSTYRGAQDIDLHPILLRDSLASGSTENIRFVQNISQLISIGALDLFLQGLPS
jgi:nicotinamidase-related amidase